MWLALQALAGLAALLLGGESLVRGASALARRLGVSPLAIGLTVVAFGTSAPELVVSLDAALSGANDISVGNVVGSNVANVGLILGLSVLIRPALVEAKLVRVDGPIMIAASLGAALALVDGAISRGEGVALLGCLAAYTGFTFWESRRESSQVRDEFASAVPGAPEAAPLAALRVAAGLGLMVVGGHLLVDSAVALTEVWGVGQAAIGLTLVALGTSLPELATSLIAAFRGKGDIAVGNVVGSNLFNILGILGVTALVQPLRMGGITWLDLGVMLGLACALTGMLFVRLRLGRPEGALLLVSYAVYMAWLLSA